MDAMAVVLQEPQTLELTRLDLTAPGAADVVVEIDFSGISTGTERLLYSGRMPPFPGLGYPLVPGYESVGRISAVGPDAGLMVGEHVFVPGANCFGPVRGLFGGAASRLVVPGARVTPIGEAVGEQGVLFALAATAYHAIIANPPELIVGHGVLGRLVARIVVAIGAPAPVVWELNPARSHGAAGYIVLDPASDPRRDYATICDVSGDSTILDSLVMRLAPGGEIILAGFYSEPLSFAFPPAFMREARMRVAAQWQKTDLDAVKRLVESGTLSLKNLITHRQPASAAPDAYRVAFGDPDCLKMVLDWRMCS
jgi:3-hydroxyethyl bacteriochlorophyllide a dehydrogenase